MLLLVRLPVGVVCVLFFPPTHPGCIRHRFAFVVRKIPPCVGFVLLFSPLLLYFMAVKTQQLSDYIFMEC